MTSYMNGQWTLVGFVHGNMHVYIYIIRATHVVHDKHHQCWASLNWHAHKK